MSQPLPDTGSSIVIEAPTAEEALAEVTQRLGQDAEIVDADRALRGGVGGFFQREVVRLTARPRADRVVEADDAGVAAALARLTEDVSVQEESFGSVLRRTLTVPAPPPAPAPVAAVAAPGPAPDDVIPARSARPSPRPAPHRDPAPRSPSTPMHPGTPPWSPEALLRLGLPEAVVAPCRSLDPADDLAWLAAIAAAVTPLCRPLPSGPSLLAGPRATRLATALGLATVTPPAPLPALGDTAAKVRPQPGDRAWLAHVRGDRWLHLVAGGARWRTLLDDEPLAVSWLSAADLPDVLRAAAELGLVLGYGLDGAGARRAHPTDVAVAVRALVAGR